MRVKVTPAITTDPSPWNSIWNAMSPIGASMKRPGTQCNNSKTPYTGT